MTACVWWYAVGSLGRACIKSPVFPCSQSRTSTLTLGLDNSRPFNIIIWLGYAIVDLPL